jgi:stress-induced-phosphoprotein 1
LGNQAFKAGDYPKAIEHYSEAIKIDPSAHTYWSNRSASYAGLGDWENAANDASECVKADKNFVKGYFRLALAQKNLQRFEQALETITRGLQVDFGNNDLKSMRKEVEDGLRLQKVASYIDQAKQQFANKEYSACLSTIDSGLRIDAGNASLVALQKKVQPLWEKEEKTRKAGLSPVEKMKEEGDAQYKNANFEGAIQQYTKTLNKIDDKGMCGSEGGRAGGREGG